MLADLPGAIVLYESPYRIEKLLGELVEWLPDRLVVVARELTKRFEEFLRGRPAEILGTARQRKLQGESVVMIGPADPPPMTAK